MLQAFADRWWTSGDGLRLYARDYPGASGEARVPVVCLHGLTRNSRDFEDVAPYLAATGRRVLVLDVRGRGRSAHDPNADNYSPGVYARDVGALLDQLSIARSIFVGTSMGGLITMALAAARPDLVAAAAINDVGPRLSPVGLGRILAYTGKPVDVRSWKDARAYAERINGAAFPSYGKTDWGRFARRLFDENDKGRPVLAYDPAITVPFRTASPDKPAPDMDPLWRGLADGRPTLLLHGALSDLLDDDGVRHMQALTPALQVVHVPGVGHAPMLTEAEAKAALLAFLARQP